MDMFGIVLDDGRVMGVDGLRYNVSEWSGIARSGDVVVLSFWSEGCYGKVLLNDRRSIGLATLDRLEKLYEAVI